MITKHDVIIEVDEVVSQCWDTMKMALYGRGTVRREVGVVGEDVLQDTTSDTCTHTHTCGYGL